MLKFNLNYISFSFKGKMWKGRWMCVEGSSVKEGGEVTRASASNAPG